MAFALDSDLTSYAPEVFDQGVTTWVPELNKAEQDVSDKVQVKWYNNHHNRSDFAKSKLTEAQWTKATVYRALANYILPQLSTFRPEGDPFMNQIGFYKELFEEEMDLQFALGIEYDKDGDGSIDSVTEVHEYRQDRLYR